MKYEAIEPLSRNAAEAAFASGDREAIVHALLGLAMHDDGWRWVQTKCVEFAHHPDPWIQRACAISLLHIARIHRQLDPEPTRLVFERLFANPELAAEAREIREEIDSFLTHRPE